MATNPMETVDKSWKGLYKWGGISLLLIGVLYFVLVILALSVGTLPTGGEAYLTWLSSRTTLAYSIYGIGIITDIMMVPVAFALYLALKGINKNAMLAYAGFTGLFIALDLGVTSISWVALITLSQNYATATSNIPSAAYVATADYVLGVTAVSGPIFSYVIPSIGLLIASLVMLKGIFSRVTAYVGITGSILGFIYGISLFVPALAIISLAIATILDGVWDVLAGFKLYELGKQ